MKNPLYITFLVIVLICILLGFAGYHYIQTGVQSAPLIGMVTESDKRIEETDALSVKVTYPTVPEITQKAVDVNKQMRTALDERIEGFERDAEEGFRETIDLPKDIKSTVTGSPSVEENNARYIAIFMGMEWYMRGAAHPSHSIDTYVYDYKESKLVTTPEMFKEGVDYLALLSKLSREDLMAQSKFGDLGFVYDREMVELGTAATIDNFSRMLPLKDGLAIYFEEYQIAPYAAGPQQVVIPYAKLKDSINPDGVLGIYLP